MFRFTEHLVMSFVNICKSCDFSLRRLQTKVFIVTCESGVGGLDCLLLINVLRSNETAPSDLLSKERRRFLPRFNCIVFKELTSHLTEISAAKSRLISFASSKYGQN